MWAVEQHDSGHELNCQTNFQLRDGFIDCIQPIGAIPDQCVGARFPDLGPVSLGVLSTRQQR